MHDKCSQSQAERAALWLLLATIAVLYGIYSYLTPFVIDDIMFRNVYLSHSGGSEAFSFEALRGFAQELRANDNSRLSNILDPIMTMMVPKWLFSAVSGIGVALMFLLMTKIAGVKGGRTAPSVLIAWVSSLVLLPWRNYIIVCDYLLNYLYPTLFVLAFIILLSKAAAGRLNPYTLLAAVAVAAVAAWFHEGFSVPVCFGFAAYAVRRRFRLPLQWWLPAVVFGLMALYVAFAPGIISRAGREFNGHSIADKFFVLCTVLPAVVMLTAVFVAGSVFPRMRALMKSLFAVPAFLMLVVAAYVAAIIVLMVDSDPRAGWPAEIFSMSALLFFVPYIRIGAKKAVLAALAVVYIAVCVFFVNLLRWQWIFERQHSRIERLLAESPDGTVYYDIIDPRSARKTTLFMAIRNQWVISFQYNVLNDTPEHPGKYYAVVPSALADFSPDKAEVLEGSGKLRLYKGVLVGEDGHYKDMENGWFADDAIYDFVTDDGRVHAGVGCFRVRFRDAGVVYRMYVWPSSEPVEGRIVRADFVGF